MNTIKIVKKPWGEEHWLAANGKYAYKRIYIKAGTRTSLQYHNFKLETNYIISGIARVFLCDKWYDMKADDFFTVEPKTVHRIEAITDLILQEVSTPELDDVIRLEDDQNRCDGRINSEHV